MFKKPIFQNTVNKHRTQNTDTEHTHMLKTFFIFVCIYSVLCPDLSGCLACPEVNKLHCLFTCVLAQVPAVFSQYDNGK